MRVLGFSFVQVKGREKLQVQKIHLRLNLFHSDAGKIFLPKGWNCFGRRQELTAVEER